MKQALPDKMVNEAYQSIREILEKARYTAYRAVNFSMVSAYWQIGKVIVEEEQKGKKRANYGETLIDELSQRLTRDYGKGFSKRNLWYTKDFYVNFPILHSLRAELSWTHYRILLKVGKKDAREFYLVECIKNNWSTRELERQIDSLLYERLALSKDKEKVKELSLKGQAIEKPDDLIKDPYVLEFLNLPENNSYLEKDLEQALIDKLQEFLLELGRGFSFISRQKRITLDGDHYYIDLVFYNYMLRCFVLIDLKTGKLTHQDIGQMDFYVRYYEKEEKQVGDNPTIGVILCTDKNQTMVKYTLLENNKQIYASKYKLILPTEKELQEEINKQKQLIETQKKQTRNKN